MGNKCISLLSIVFGQHQIYYTKFSELFSNFDEFWAVFKAMGVLRAAREEVESGYLFETRKLIEAEVFDDFLEQAGELLIKGYYQPAAVLTGSVLEDGIRKLCIRNAVTLSAKPKLETMNADLVKAGIYNVLQQKKITALADLRNKAAHGQWDQFDKQDVEEMISGVRRFMEEYFS